MTTGDASGSFAPAEIATHLVEAAERFCELTDRISDENAVSPFAPDWTARQIVEHVTFLPRYYSEIARGEAELIADATEMGAKNLDNIALIGDTSLAECRDRIRSGVAELAELVASSDERTQVDFQAGATATLGQLGGMAIGEYEIHGLDLASALGEPWVVTPEGAAMAAMTAMPAAGAAWLDAAATGAHSGSYEIRLRGGLGKLRLDFDEGDLQISTSPSTERMSPRPDTVVSADPAAFLRVFYGRQSQWSAIGRGQMVSFGRKPWRALSLRTKFLPV